MCLCSADLHIISGTIAPMNSTQSINSLPERFDVIVVGGGHAGVEAALGAARSGVKTLLLTHNIETIGQMSCNPAIGGLGKSHLVKEIDALGGAMACAADEAGIHFRTLNARKGPAVRATRAQADRQLYRQAIRRLVEAEVNLSVLQQNVEDLLIADATVIGVVTASGLKLYTQAVVLATGTFLGGRMHMGEQQQAGGRAGDLPANALAARLRELPFTVGRLKTGTPPRVDGRTVDFSCLTEQHSEVPRPVFSFIGNRDQHPPQRSCYIAQTNTQTHDIVRANLNRSPMYNRQVTAVGPRYCPSLEDKIVRFADKSSHRIFIEPEGLQTHELYPNGLSTSLPFPVQVQLIRSMQGFANARITRPGYAIEYDYFSPQGLKHSLETRPLKHLFFAGQINGTTGYEEAAAQGLVAGVNAARRVQGLTPWQLTRQDSYIGVLIDDLITHGVSEPYRMFTSRVEYRLALREDNADLRLTPKGRELGLVDDARWQMFLDKRDGIECEQRRLGQIWIHPTPENQSRLAAAGIQLKQSCTAENLLRRPEVSYALLDDLPGFPSTGQRRKVIEQVEIQAHYSGYLKRQQQEVERLQSQGSLRIPTGFSYQSLAGLSNELKEKLIQFRPETLGQARRIQGMTPAAVAVISLHLKRAHKRQ